MTLYIHGACWCIIEFKEDEELQEPKKGARLASVLKFGIGEIDSGLKILENGAGD